MARGVTGVSTAKFSCGIVDSFNTLLMWSRNEGTVAIEASGQKVWEVDWRLKWILACSPKIGRF